MSRRSKLLYETDVKNAKPRTNQYKMYDSDGLLLLVTPAGGRLWKLKYRWAGREKSLSLGAYPEISLSVARKRCEDARKQIPGDCQH
jgi:hypothetical protein